MNIWALKGHRVKCGTLTAGYPSHQEVAQRHLELGKEYTVDRTEVDSWHTDVLLQEFPGVRFNSVFFEDAAEQSAEQDPLHPDYHRFN